MTKEKSVPIDFRNVVRHNPYHKKPLTIHGIASNGSTPPSAIMAIKTSQVTTNPTDLSCGVSNHTSTSSAKFRPTYIRIGDATKQHRIRTMPMNSIIYPETPFGAANRIRIAPNNSMSRK